ncbi:cyclic nucleotide-binding domain-containing protein [Desulfopila aestuarii]|uniref:cAMP-binding domain of CRP or a regulatory subunit of cAMP-dependent protein kinases n=1 Tax=Desulfopila aestuarii DSM 18488 TaxID=1121416 RepID=A0A1M7Y888_9BACT|nr:cyclic nucleotide-binding domain-containing protein [Desulfopila aestuarii]SHO48837.1 cAMP-binding domain of CRP or a regulatory subunit of cAMP-dependent protein kinases [Desulfopila aestuarii DSM 18488]
MTEAIRQQECLNTLKTFNNTVVTIRLYPPNAPQIANAVERGYKSVKQFLRQYGAFTIALRGNEPELCGEVLDPQVVQSISNLIVFRHLNLLQTDRLSITAGLDRTGFKRILEIFSAKVDQIKQEDGGWAYITRLGLNKYFADPNAEKSEEAEEKTDGPAAIAEIERHEVRREYLDVLHGRENRFAVISELKSVLAIPATGAPILAAAVLGVLEGMVQKKLFVVSQPFQLIMENCGKLIDAGQARELVAETATILLKTAEQPAIVLLMCQYSQGETASMLLRALEQQIPLELFGSVIRDLRQAATQLRVTQTRDSKQLQFVIDATDRLLVTPRGKQFLGQEKAKSIIEAGEKARRSRRVEAGIKSLLQGNDEVLQSEEIHTHLPFVVRKMEAEEMDREIKVIFSKLSGYYLDGDGPTRDRAMKSLAQVAENLTEGKRYDLLKMIFEPLFHWLKTSENGDIIYEKVSLALHWLMAESWKRQEFQVGDEILSMFYQIRSGALRRPGPVRAIIGRAQDKGLDRTLMRQLLDQCLESPNDEVLSRRLILQGPIATRFLVDSLVRADETNDRLKIIDLLTYGEQFLPAILAEKLAEPMPWYGKRNLLKLLGETGSADYLEMVYPFLQHDDLRVQREAFICLYKMSGEKRRDALLRALNESGETMKLQVVRALVPLGDSEVAEGLRQVLDEHRFYSDDFRDTLLSSVCLAIARCPYPQAERILQGFLDQKGDRATRKIGAKVWKTAEEALNQVYEAQQDERQLKAKAGQLRKKSLLTKGIPVKGGEPERRNITGLTEEKTIRELVANDDKDLARAHLLELITKVSRLRRFTQAEQLREWLIEIDSSALTDIIRAAEIIEEEKHSAVDKGHLEIWSGLFDVLTTEEFSAFYHALQHKQFSDEEVIIKKGATQNALFFINTGKVKLFFRDKDREMLAATLQGGQILGIGSFFDASVWTISAAALGQVDVSILKFENMQEWSESYPALESKLHDFCLKFESVDKVFSKAENDRRRYPRYPTPPLRLAVTLLNSAGQGGVTTKADLADLSRGGGSFFMRISKRENARLLLGRSLKIALPVEEPDGRAISFSGVIVAVRAQHAMEYEYSVHVEFDTVLDSSQMQKIMRLL